MANKQADPASKNVWGFIKAHKKPFITAAALLAAVVILLVIIDPANSPSAAFGRYIDCMHSQNGELYQSVSYDANFSKSQAAEDVVSAYKARFSTGNPDLLKDACVQIIKEEPVKATDMGAKRSSLAESYRNANRVTDVRTISFRVTRDTAESTGSATLVCVTGKWYVGEVTGI